MTLLTLGVTHFAIATRLTVKCRSIPRSDLGENLAELAGHAALGVLYSLYGLTIH